ncbi:MAG TPA: S9 family peptidase [Thermoanaerobaculia bacterium]
MLTLRRLLRATWLGASLFVLPHALPAQLPPSLGDPLRRIFEAEEYKARSLGAVHWLDGGRAYVVLEDSATQKDLKDVVAYDTATGRREVLVPAGRLQPSGAAAPIPIEGFAAIDRDRFLLFTASKKVWRRNTRGDYWYLDRRRGAPRKLGGGGGGPSSLMFAKVSPDGTRAAWVRDNDLSFEDLSSGEVFPLTRDGSATTINGTSDWVNEEELDIRDGFRWSPDGKRIAFWQFDTTGVEIFTLLDDTDSLYPTVRRFPYPKAGTRNSAVRIGVVDVATRAVVWMQPPGDPRENYIARMDWVDNATLALERLNRLQNRSELVLADARTGDARPVYHDESKTWVDVVDEVRWIAGNREFLWESEKDGWRHVYRAARSGSGEKLVTRLDGDVIGVAGVDEKAGVLYFLASPDSGVGRSLYRSPLDGSGPAVRVTPADAAGTHAYELSPDGRFAIHTASTFDRPPTIDLVSLPDHKRMRVLVDNAEVAAKAAPLLASKSEFFRLPIGDGVALDAWLLTPPDFDPSRKYPLLVYVYGEPAGQTVVDQWGGDRGLFHRALAAQGYLVASFDNRGTPAPRGAAWRKIVYGAVGALTSKDQAAAVKALAAARPYVDASRVAIWGWSGGGSSTLNAMFRFPDVYRVGIAVAPVPDQKLYDTIYQERYMGLPQDDADGYKLGSPINFAEGLQGRLLLVHGSGDDNVHYQGTEMLVNRLIELGKTFDLMVYPNRTHAINEGKGTSLHLHRLIARYLLTNLPPGPPPSR